MQQVCTIGLISAVVLIVALPTAAVGQAVAPAGRDIAADAGLGSDRVLTHGETAVRDFDADGDRDIVLSYHASAPYELLERVDGQRRYRRVPNIPFGKPDRHSCAWGNANADPRPDLYCSLGGRRGQTTGKSNELWIQQPDGGFVQRAEEFGVADPLGRGRDVTFLDVDNARSSTWTTTVTATCSSATASAPTPSRRTSCSSTRATASAARRSTA